MKKNNYIIRLEKIDDYRIVENLTREAFWNIYRPGCTEHYVLHQFRHRKDFIPDLDFIIEKDGNIIGHVMYAYSSITSSEGVSIPIMTLGPISILPHFQRQGYGTILLQYSMQKSKEMGANALAITGNIAFYGKSGFITAKSKGIKYANDPEADYFLVAELSPNFLDGITGTYTDPSGYFVDDSSVDEFDTNFPPKKKLRLPGQIF